MSNTEIGEEEITKGQEEARRNVEKEQGEVIKDMEKEQEEMRNEMARERKEMKNEMERERNEMKSKRDEERKEMKENISLFDDLKKGTPKEHFNTSHKPGSPPACKSTTSSDGCAKSPIGCGQFRFNDIIGQSFASSNESAGLCAAFLTAFSYLLIVVTFPVSLFFCIKVVQEYERAVIFRLGRLMRGGAKGPGIFFIIPCIDTYCKVDLRTVSFDVPPQEILSKDSVTVAVDAVVYYRISNATIAVSNVEDYGHSTRLLAATTLRNVLGTKNLSEILSERETISHVMQSSLDEATDPWGVKVERVEIKDVRLPVQLQRAMAAEAEAAREARAKVIAAEGEQRASRALKEAAEVIADSPSALQLRYLQTLNSIAAEKNSTIVFPLPMELFRGMQGRAHQA